MKNQLGKKISIYTFTTGLSALGQAEIVRNSIVLRGIKW